MSTTVYEKDPIEQSKKARELIPQPIELPDSLLRPLHQPASIVRLVHRRCRRELVGGPLTL